MSNWDFILPPFWILTSGHFGTVIDMVLQFAPNIFFSNDFTNEVSQDAGFCSRFKSYPRPQRTVTTPLKKFTHFYWRKFRRNGMSTCATLHEIQVSTLLAHPVFGLYTMSQWLCLKMDYTLKLTWAYYQTEWKQIYLTSRSISVVFLRIRFCSFYFQTYVKVIGLKRYEETEVIH